MVQSRPSLPAFALLVALGATYGAAGAQSKPDAADAPAAFDDLARRAADARDSGRLGEAIDAYRQAVGARPAWDEGWWYLGTLHYEQRQDAEAREALTRFLALKPEAGPAWALRGLCLFREGRLDESLADLGKARALGFGSNDELKRAAWYHSAILLLRRSDFELAVEPLTLLARSEAESTSLTEAIGLLVLRLPYLPTEIPADRRELVMAAGGAGYAWLARAGDQALQRFRSLVERYPNIPFVHYAYGVFLLQSDSEAALAEFRREIEVNPRTPFPHLEIAFELLRRGEPSAALPSAEQAVTIAPDLFAARNALGRALVDTGELERGIRELEAAVKLAPESPEVHYSLATAYARAGRKEDAERERAVFLQLSRGQ